jgi:restriction endonuclease S subunit
VELDAEYDEIGVRSFGRGIFHKEPVSGADLGKKRVFFVEPGDLVVSNVFAWEGAIGVASDHDAGRIGSHRFMTFVPKDGRIDTSWAAWFFLSEPGLELVRAASPGSAGRNRTLAIDRFEAVEIPLPPIEEQHSVAHELDHVASCTDNLRILSKRASDLTTALVVSLATRPDLHNGQKRETGWSDLRLGEIMTPADAKVEVDPGGSYRIAGVYSFGRGLIDRGTIQGTETSYRTLHRLKDGDIVFSKLGAWEGAVAVVTEAFDGYFASTEFPSFVAKKGVVVPGFLGGLFRSPQFWAAMNQGTQGSMARRKRITPDQFLRTVIWLPPVSVQMAALEMMEAVSEASISRTKMDQRVDALVPAALNQAFAAIS